MTKRDRVHRHSYPSRSERGRGCNTQSYDNLLGQFRSHISDYIDSLEPCVMGKPRVRLGIEMGMNHN